MTTLVFEPVLCWWWWYSGQRTSHSTLTYRVQIDLKSTTFRWYSGQRTSPSTLTSRVQIDLKSTIFGGPVVNNVLDFYSERPSSNSAEVVNFSILKNFVERAKNKRKKRLGWPLK